MEISKFAISEKLLVTDISNLHARGMHRTVGIRTQFRMRLTDIGLTLSTAQSSK